MSGNTNREGSAITPMTIMVRVRNIKASPLARTSCRLTATLPARPMDGGRPGDSRPYRTDNGGLTLASERSLAVNAGVGAFSTDEEVDVGAAVEPVVSFVTLDTVSAFEAVQPVGADRPAQCIPAFRPDDPVGPRSSLRFL